MTAINSDVPISADRQREWSIRSAVGSTAVTRFVGLYLLILMIVLFSIWGNPAFATLDNARVTAASQAIAGILTMGAVVSLISGVLDISIAANMSFAISLVGWLQANAGLNPALAVLLTILAGAAIGGVNAFVITVVQIDPVVATLGTSAILAAAAFWLVDGQTILYGISPSFTSLGTGKFLSIPNPVYFFAVVALVLWYALEHTPWGRYLRATGANPQASRLAGVRTRRIQWSALLVSGSLASLAGVVLTMQLGASSFGAGGPYLLPAFAACFLGSALIQPGRFNVWGTVIALYMLAVAVKGLQLSFPSTPWLANLIQGATLICAVGITGLASRRKSNH